MYYLICIYAANFLAIINTSSIKILLPGIMQDLTVQMNWLTWAANSFTLPFAILLPICGYAGDRHGPYRFYISGLVTLSVGSLLCGLAPSFAALVGGRIIQAFGAAMLVPNSLTLLLWLTPTRRHSRSLGLWGTIGALGGITGPVLAGILTSYFSWRSSFYLLSIFCLFILLLSSRIPVPKQLGAGEKNRTEVFDYPGALLLFLFLSGVNLAITLLPDLGWSHHWIQLLLGLSFLTGYLFLQVEKKADSPMIDLSLIRQPHFYLGLATGWLEQAAIAGILFTMPLYFILVRGIDVDKTALLLTPSAIAFAIACSFAGKVVDQTGFGIPILSGMFVRMCSFLLLFYITGMNYGSILAIVITLFFSGFGQGLTNIPALYAVLSVVDKKNYGMAGGMQNMFRYVGTVFGTSASGIIVYVLADRPAVWGLAGPAPEFSAALLFCAGICLLGVCISILFFKKRNKNERSV